MAGRNVKVTADDWVSTARVALVEEGITGVKVDRLAKRLKVTRGGFFHNFKDRDELLATLLHHWEDDCKFLPASNPGGTAADAIDWVEELTRRLIDEDGYDHAFDMAVREWARSDARTAWAVQRADRQRLHILEKFFDALGYACDEAKIRARVFYYHQIGYYAIGVQQNLPERRRQAEIYLDILCGHEVMQRARMQAQKHRAV
jgi:AcrR family transcriptional regulator